MSICVLVPSRGRPERAKALRESIDDTSHGRVRVVFLVDPDDQSLAGYAALEPVVLPERIGYTASLNAGARSFGPAFSILGAFGDDVLFRTPDWDRTVEQTLATPGIAYGDDLIHGKNHPSAVFMSTVIADALGWLALPATSHQWADDGWKRLGEATGLLRFMPDVVVEHMHPAVGKADWDETYAGVFQDARAKADFEGFSAWAEAGLADDVAKVRRVSGVAG